MPMILLKENLISLLKNIIKKMITGYPNSRIEIKYKNNIRLNKII
jgi:hypothetical protein